MSNGRAFRRRLTDMFGPLDGARIPGGCNTCDAYQTVQPVTDGIWSMTVHHDDHCPTLAERENNAEAPAARATPRPPPPRRRVRPPGRT